MSLFSSPQAASGRRKELRSKACFGSWKKKSFYQKMTPKGMLTASGVYMDIVLEMQNQQRWADSTCRLYDNLFWKYVAKIFESIDFTTLTEKEAENIWLEKINVFAGNEEADQRSRRLFEVLVECAHVKGLTTLTFKNFYKDGPFELPDDIQLLTPAQRVIVRRAAEKFKQRLKSLTIESAIKIYRELLKQAPEKGECIALLMMLLLALRTAEAGGLSFGDIRKMEKDEYSIERRFVLDGDTRRIIEGSKTDNGYRLLPLVKELYNLLEERRRQAEKYLKAMGIKKDIDTLPLACHGKDFLTRCTKKEINNVFKDVCKKVGVLKDFYLKDEEKQEIFFEIKAMMLIDQEACQEYDGTVVAYLLRHQAATELALTSASREAISVLMGHKIENPNVKSFDFSNIEGQRELRDILMRRPLYRYICNKMDVKEIPAQAGTHKAYFTDGSDKEITVVEVNGKDLTVADNSVVDLDGNKQPQTGSYLTTNNKIVVGMMYRYETKKNGDYKLYALSNSTSKDRAGYKTYDAADSATYTNKTERLTVNRTSFTIADDAAVYVQTTNAAATGDKVKVITGKALKKWADTTGLYAQVLANETNGAKNAKVVSIVYNAASISSASDDSYGFVTATPVRVTNTDGDKVWQYEIWNGSKTITVFEDKTSQSADKGEFIQYNVVSDTEIEDIQNNIGSYDAVTAIDGDKIDTTSNTALGIDDKDTQVIYVNTKDTKGVEGGKIALADEPIDGNYTKNVYVVNAVNGKDLDAIFVDVNNKMEKVTYTAVLSGAATQKIGNITYTVAVKASPVALGKNVEITVTPDKTVDADATVTVKCNETGATKSVSFANGDTTTAKTITFSQEAYNTTYSIVK